MSRSLADPKAIGEDVESLVIDAVDGLAPAVDPEDWYDAHAETVLGPRTTPDDLLFGSIPVVEAGTRIEIKACKRTVSNLEFGEERITFDFLVGYQDRRVLEGVVPAYLEFAALLEGGMPVELIGEVLTAENEAGFRLRVTSLRMLEPGSRD